MVDVAVVPALLTFPLHLCCNPVTRKSVVVQKAKQQRRRLTVLVNWVSDEKVFEGNGPLEPKWIRIILYYIISADPGACGGIFGVLGYEAMLYLGAI